MLRRLSDRQSARNDFLDRFGYRQGPLQSILGHQDLEHAENPVIAVLRLVDDPDEYTRPQKSGDIIIVWSPNRDGGIREPVGVKPKTVGLGGPEMFSPQSFTDRGSQSAALGGGLGCTSPLSFRRLALSAVITK